MDIGLPSFGHTSATIREHTLALRTVLWLIASLLLLLGSVLRPQGVWRSALGLTRPFLTLGLVILAGAVLDRAGAFRLLSRLPLRDRAGPRLSVALTLTFTALLSGLINLDVAVVVSMPVSLAWCWSRRLSPSRAAIAVALTANATSFLLPTSNLTNLLVLRRAPSWPLQYLDQSWLPWLLVASFTIACLSLLNWGSPLKSSGRADWDSGAAPLVRASAVAPLSMLLDLAPLFLVATAVRALFEGSLVLSGSLLHQTATGVALAAGLDNLPAASAITTTAPASHWAAILACAIGPNILITGSVATLICRRLALESGAGFNPFRFSAVGILLLPPQLALAWAGLHLSGAL